MDNNKLIKEKQCSIKNIFNSYVNPFAPGDFAEKRVWIQKLVEWFSGHCHAIKS